MTADRLAGPLSHGSGRLSGAALTEARLTPADVVEIVTTLAHAASDAVDPAIAEAVARMGTACGADRVHVLRIGANDHLTRTHHWSRPGTPATAVLREAQRASLFDSWLSSLVARKPLIVTKTRALPDAEPLRASLLAQQVTGLVALPMVADGGLFGLLLLSFVGDQATLSDGDVALLQSLTEIILSVLTRRESERRAEEAAQSLCEDRALLDSILQTSTSAIFTFDRAGCLVFANDEAEAITGLPRAALVGQMHDNPIFGSATLEGRPLLPEDYPVATVLRSGRALRDQRLTLIDTEGDRRILSVNAAPVVVDGTLINVVCTFSDVTAQVSADTALRTALAEAHQLAFFDPLTGLYNRRGIIEVLRDGLALCDREGGFLALLYIDVDGMRSVNGNHGHYQGDMLLQGVSERLMRLSPPSSDLGRMSSDEFVLIFGELQPDAEAATTVARIRAEAILNGLREPYDLGGVAVDVTVSIGLTPIAAGDTSAGLMKSVDLAVMSAKAAGGNRITTFEPGMEQQLAARMALAQDLRDGLRRDEFRLYYEPKIRKSGDALTVIGHEALIRWQHPERGLIGASDFVPFAEETGFTQEMDVWVLREACMELRRRATDRNSRNLRLSVNISSAHFLSADFAALVQRTLSETGANPRLLELEVTEGTLLSNLSAARATMMILRDMGLTLALDDFGTGFSSLSYLRDLPVDVIKIDRSFVVDLMDQRSNKTILEGIIGLARGLGVKIVAEGVETEAQLAWLYDKGCRVFQGYYFGKPNPVAITSLGSRLQLPTAAAAQK